MTSQTEDIATGLATLIAGAGLGIDYSAAGLYTPDQTGIFQKMSPATPDRIVTLTVVPLTDQPSLPMGQVMVQVRGRSLPGQPMDVDSLMDSIKTILHGARDLTFGAVHVVQILRQITVPLGMDSAKRWERADQYYLDCDYSGTTNIPATGW